jgi:AcrR family transcriptional regulator
MTDIATEPGTRERILAAAVDLFATQGYDATSITQVIDRAGVAKGGLYHHFVSKQQLLFEVYGDLITRQLEGMQRIVDSGQSPDRVLRALIMDLVETTAASAQQALVFFRELSKLGDEHESELRRARRHYHDAVTGLVRDGQRDGQFRAIASAETITFIVFGVINELPLWYRPGGRKRPDQIATELADFVLAALQPVAAPSTEAGTHR